MVDQFGVTPAGLRSTAEDLHDVSLRVKGVMSSLRAQLAGVGDGWCQGATNGHLTQLAWVLGSVDAETNLLDYCSNVLGQAADAFEQAKTR